MTAATIVTLGAIGSFLRFLMFIPSPSVGGEAVQQLSWPRVKLVNVKNGELALFRAVRKGEHVKVIDEKGKEKVIDLKEYSVMTRGSVGLKAVKAIKFV